MYSVGKKEKIKRKRKRMRVGKRKGKRRGGTAGIYSISGKMAREMNRTQHAKKLTVHGPSGAQFLTGQVF